MKTEPTPTALTDELIIAILATKVMGWEKWTKQPLPLDHSFNGCWLRKGADSYKAVAAAKDWNPLCDWNDWRKVEKKVMEDEDLFRKMLHCFAPSFPDDRKDEAGAWQYIFAELRTRCLALVSVLT